MLKNRPLAIIIATAFLDLLGFGIVLPSLPFIIRSYWASDAWVGITMTVFSLGTFVAGMYLGRLSDIYGRKKLLIATTLFSLAGYILFFFSSNLWVFLLARLLGGFGGAGMAIGQAYVSDISAPEDRTKNMGAMGAVFGLSFMIGPVLGGLVSNGSLHVLGAISSVVIFLNLLVIIFFLPNITHKTHLKKDEESVVPMDFHHHKRQIWYLFATTFLAALGFASMQATFGLLTMDRFRFDETMIGYLFGYIGLCSVLYQGLAIKYIRRIFDERGMILFGLASLIVSFILFGINPFVSAMLVIIVLFPLGYGSINPATGSLLSHYASKEAGKALGTNASMMSLGQIVGPFIATFLYTYWSGYPYFFAAGMFALAFALVMMKIRRK